MIPPLRPGVTVERDPSGPVLIDPAQRIRVLLSEPIARIVPLLDGARDAAAVAAAAQADGVRVTAAEVEGALASLGGLYVLDDPRGRARAEAAARTPPPAPPRALQVLRGDRFDCHACGFCCSNGQNFGPITEEDKARILVHDWTKEIPGVSGPDDLFVEAVAQGDGLKHAYLAQRRGRCVFLTEENLCRVHVRLGAAAKPHVCRLFPFVFARTPDGTVVSTRRDCKSLERSRYEGTPVERQLEGLEALARDDPAPIVVQELVPWGGPISVPYALARAVREAALSALAAPGEAATESLRSNRLRSVPGRQSPPGDPLAARLDPEPRSEVEHSCSTTDARLLVVRDLVCGISARLGTAPGEPELEAALAFARARAGPAPAAIPDAHAAHGRAALASLLLAMAENALWVGLYYRTERDNGPTRRDLQEAWSLALCDLLALLEPRLPPGTLPPIPPFDAARRRAIPLGPGAEAVLRDALRQEVHGWLTLAATPLFVGYILLALRHVVSVAIARRMAFARNATEVSNDDAHEGVLAATSLLAAKANRDIAMADPRRLVTFYQGLRFGDPL